MVARPLFRFLTVLLAGAALGQDVQMNDPDHATTWKGDYTAQSETNHAVTANGMIAAWNDASLFASEGTEATSRLMWRWAKTGGNVFEGGGFLQFPNDLHCFGDPAVVADSAGFIYVAGIAGVDVDNLSGLGIARTTGTMWPFSLGPATIVGGLQLDKALMAIDRTGGPYNDRIYITATLGGDGIVAKYTTSLDPIAVSGWKHLSESYATGSMAAVAPNGDVYAVWQRIDMYEIARSQNGGVSWANPDSADPAMAKLITKIDASPLHLKAYNPMKDIRANSFPQLAIDSTGAGSPTRGNLYVVYHADPDGDGPDQADIFFTRSITDGKTWSKPRSITSGLAATIGRDLTTNDSFIPAIAVSPVTGHIYVSFWDRREDTSDDDGDPVNRKTRVYRALSTDAGQTWNVIPFAPKAFVPVAGFNVGGLNSKGEISDYWSEYNWITASANEIHFTYSDARNLCASPANSPAPCVPANRPDPDVYYQRVANLSGPDLFIKPWGAVTGEGPKWKTSYIYVVDSSETKIDAVKGLVNHLRARVRNLGTAAANGVTVRFKFAPWFAGLNDGMMKTIGTKTVNLSAAGGATDNLVVPIDWDLTDLTDTNGGKWPSPLGKYEHFCVKVSVELASDINPSNNVAQSNFFDVDTASTANAPMEFIIAGPDPEDFGNEPAVAKVAVGALPPNVSARVTVEGVTDPASGFRLLPNELRRGTVHFTAPAGFQSDTDVVAEVTLLLDGRENGGISARLYDSPRDGEPEETLRETTARYWEMLPPDRTQQIRGEEGPKYEPPPMRTIPAKVRFRETFPVSYDEAYGAVLAALRAMELGPELANEERGLFNSTWRRVTRDEIVRLINDVPDRKVEAGGHYWLSVWLQPRGERETEIGVSAWIGAKDVYVPDGRRLPSNGIVEQSVLAAIGGQLEQ